MNPTKQSHAGHHLQSISPLYPTFPQPVSTPFTTGVTSPSAHAYEQPYPQAYVEPMQMYQPSYHMAHNQPLHRHVMNPAAQTFIHSTQAGPFSPGFVPSMVASTSETVPQQKSFKELLEEPMPYCDSEYCGGFCRGLADDVPKTKSQSTAKLPKAGKKKANGKWVPRKFDFFSLSLIIRKQIYRHALIPFQPKGIRRAFQLSVELKTLFILGNLGGFLESNKVARLECLQVWIEEVDLQLYHHEVPWLHSHLRPLNLLGSGPGVWNFRRFLFVADVNGVIGVRCNIDLETRVMSIDLGYLGKGATFVSVYEHHTYFYPDSTTTNISPTTVNNMVLAAKQLGSFMQPLFMEFIGKKQAKTLSVEDIQKVGDRYFAVARPTFYNVDVEETKYKWAKFIDPAHRVLYGLDEEWRPHIRSLHFTNEKSI